MEVLGVFILGVAFGIVITFAAFMADQHNKE